VTKVLLAYSGGLDTSCILQYLKDEGHTIVCYMADVGQLEDFEAARKKALALGAVACVVDDLREQFVREFVFPFVSWSAKYEGRYLLGTSVARPCITAGLVRAAVAQQCTYVAHGATGKGNDQVRFELSVASLAPHLKIIAPWRDAAFTARFKGRSDLLAYAADKKIPVEATSAKPWSMDENLFHCSYEAGELEDPAKQHRHGMCKLTLDADKAPDAPLFVDVWFERGLPTKVGVRAAADAHRGADEADAIKHVQVATEPLAIMLLLNELGRAHGVGRIDMVENRFVGIKSRGVYETPGGTVLFEAHADLEGIVLDREVRRIRDSLATEYTRLVYNGFWHSPEFALLEAVRAKAQESVRGVSTVRLYKGSASAVARASPLSLYNAKLSSMDEEGGFVPSHSTGFIAINAVRLKAHAGRV
jgi:argininosuccinate synthase